MLLHGRRKLAMASEETKYEHADHQSRPYPLSLGADGKEGILLKKRSDIICHW